MRKFYGDGRWGYPGSGPITSWNGWVLTKRRSRKVTWAINTGHKKAFKVHAVKYRLRAVHEPTGTVSLLTVWRCGQSSFSPIRMVKSPGEVCSGCWDRLAHVSTKRLS
jgi:hypothetical protein